jgi:hypothetical protein
MDEPSLPFVVMLRSEGTKHRRRSRQRLLGVPAFSRDIKVKDAQRLPLAAHFPRAFASPCWAHHGNVRSFA